jgi:hypothetical protein
VSVFFAVSIFLLFVTGTIFKLLWAVSSAIVCKCLLRNKGNPRIGPDSRFCAVVGLHMLFRPRSLQSKLNKFSDEMKLNGVMGSRKEVSAWAGLRGSL